ncbi:MAG: DEAD/DEAH box helicase [Bacteroidales bacterium]|jgi:ATP-dependent RNA helicase RhlE|nr:DEAD/DEAH box helicase [Bacteroidales bacterium]MDY0196849.1 DEAD/DEAH box helicase [Tenuifilaceae bacterium]
MKFEDLKIIEPILKALKEEKYSVPTSIQEKAIPLIIDRNDVLGSAQTGTGKTAAFAIPILQHLFLDRQRANSSRNINALIITPTRELAIQIAESFSTYGKYTGLKTAVVFGGVKQGQQTDALHRGVDILVATPGRLLDLMDQGFVKLNSVEYFVLDEADRMLDMGFIHDIRKIIAKLPAKRQSLFFSATMPDTIVELSSKILNNPIKVDVSPISSTADTIRQYLYYTNKATKLDLLIYILQDPKIDQVLLFSRTKHGADKITRHLKKGKIQAAAIHGDKAQNARQKVLQQFKDGEIRVLVATDIAARGIDIDKLKYVINYDIPNIAETYVHRIGRCGRAGDEGVSISICEPEENVFIKDIETLIDQKIKKIKDNPFPQTDNPMTTKEKQVFEKEKIKRKQEYFASKNKSRPDSTKYNRRR